MMVTVKGRVDVGDFGKKESMKVFIASSHGFDAVVREKGVKMAVVSSPGNLETLGSVGNEENRGRG